MKEVSWEHSFQSELEVIVIVVRTYGRRWKESDRETL